MTHHAGGLRVERSSPFVQLQDAGRFGVRHLGVSQSGALDWISMYWANWLLGNALDAVVVEITLGNFDLYCAQDACLALAGADLGATLDGQPLLPWRTFSVRRGQHLRFAQPRLGARAYLAAPGGFNASAVLGSCSGSAREQLGGLHGDGKPLAVGDCLQWSERTARPRRMDELLIPQFVPTPQLQLVMGAQIGDFDGRSLFNVFNSIWQIDTRADRMGIRILGPRLHISRATTISEGIPLGAVQVPPDGQPIILLNDRQTIGGYPRLGALTPQAVARLAQCLPGERLHLAPVLQETAQDSHLRLLEQWQGLDR